MSKPVDSSVTYEQFDKAFSRVGAYAIFQGADYIARLVIKYPADGAGRLYCYAQVWGAGMVRAHAAGGGYDKRTAAAYGAVQSLPDHHGRADSDPRQVANTAALKAALSSDGGHSFVRQLEAAGFTVACVVD